MELHPAATQKGGDYIFFFPLLTENEQLPAMYVYIYGSRMVWVYLKNRQHARAKQ